MRIKIVRSLVCLFALGNLIFIINILNSISQAKSPVLEIIRIIIAVMLTVAAFIWLWSHERKSSLAWWFMTAILGAIFLGFLINITYAFARSMGATERIVAIVSQVLCAFGVYMCWSKWWLPKKGDFHSSSVSSKK
jgi:hypothetical protein